MVAGEASGDLLASLLLRGLHERWPGTRAAGIGGPRMLAQGFDAWWPSEKLAVFGYVDALRHYRELVGIRNALCKRLLAERPDVFIGVDAPDFNFGLEGTLRAAGIKTVHFVCPSIWAWRGERAKKLAAAADHVLCLFPFEPALLAEHGVDATFVGHPLADTIPLVPPRAAARRAQGLPSRTPWSRCCRAAGAANPLHRAGAAACRLDGADAARPALRAAGCAGLRPMVDPLLAEHAAGATIQLLDGRSHEALAACDVTLIASGTATLEAALYKRPMVITYRMHWLNWQYMKRRAYQRWFGLPNILSRKFIVPELLQDAATPSALAREALAWLDDAPRRETLTTRLNELHLSLRQDTARKAGDAIAQILQQA
jgi:lipid-A-disaccharide synthase